MPEISNLTASPFTLPTGETIPAGGTASVEKIDAKHPVVASLLEQGGLKKGRPAKASKIEKPSTDADVKKAVDDAVAAVTAERDAVKNKLDAAQAAVRAFLTALNAEPFDEPAVTEAEDTVRAALNLPADDAGSK